MTTHCAEEHYIMIAKLLRLKMLVLALLLGTLFSAKADNIYIMNAPGYNEAGPELIAAMEALGHTVTVSTTNLNVFPLISSACVDPNGYHWLCFFGPYDFSALSPQVGAFIADGGKVYYNYEVSCCTASSQGAASMISAITGLPVTVNATDAIGSSGLPTGGGWIANLGGCIDIIGAAYKGLDGLPVANQLQADAVINGAIPDVSVCENFGYFFTGADIPGNTLNGSITGMGDINVWYDGSEPWSNGGIDPVNMALVEYFFPNENSTCFLATSGCSNDCPFGNVLGPDAEICEGDQLILDATAAGAISYLWQDNSVGTTFTANGAGTYYVEVSDGTVTCTDTIHVEEIIVNAQASSDITICQGLSAVITASGGDSYSWSPAATLDDGNIQSPTASPIVTTTYTVTATIGLCTDTDEVTVFAEAADVDYLTFVTPAVCAIDGTVIISQVNGGFGPYTISLDNVDILADDVIDLPAGDYELSIVDQIGCSLITTVTVADESYNLDLIIESTNPYCALEGSIEVTDVTNEIGVVSYFLNAVPEADGIFDELNAGNYEVIVRDDNGCEGESLLDLIYDDGSVAATVTALDPICLTPGSILVSDVANAQTPFSISSNGNIALNGEFLGLAGGEYEIEVVDADGCLFTQTVSLEFQDSDITAVLSTQTVICESPGQVLNVEPEGGAAPYVIEIDDDFYTGPGFEVDSTLHTLLITDLNGCEYEQTFQVGFINHTEAAFTPTPYIANIPFEVITENESLNADTYEWHLDGELVSEELTPDFTFLNAGEYEMELIAIDTENGCRDSMFYIIYALPPNTIYIPNAFSPDNDGLNDVFMIKGENLSDKDFELLIFNRYGDVVWRADEPKDAWTGNHRLGEYFVPDGVYTYLCNFKFDNSFEAQTLKGTLTIIR